MHGARRRSHSRRGGRAVPLSVALATSMARTPPDDLAPAVLAGLRRGEADALADCYRAFGARVYRICRGLLRQEHDAQDATQEVFLKVLERASQFGGRSRFATWLHRLTVNHCLHRLEKEERRRAGSLDRALDRALDDERACEPALVARDPSPAEGLVAREARKRVEDLLARLPAEQRAVLVLRELEGLSYAAIAEVLGVPPGTVMSRLARARERLLGFPTDEHGELLLPPARHVS